MSTKEHVGYRLPVSLVEAIQNAAEARDVTHTEVVQAWLTRMAKAEGFLDESAVS